MLKTRLRIITVADVILVIIILFCAAGSYLYLNKGRSEAVAYIYYRNSLIGTYSLAQEQKVQINAECIAEIKKEKIRMASSDCPDKLCVKQGWSEKIPIICLPNQIVIEIRINNKQKIHILH